MIAAWDSTSAESLLALTSDQVRSVFGQKSPEASELLLRKVRLARMKRDPAAASRLRDLEKINRRLPPDNYRRALMLLEKGRLARQEALYTEAMTSFRSSLALLDTTRASDSLTLADVHCEIGVTLMNDQKFADAEPHILRVLEIRRRLLGDAHYETARARLYNGTVRCHLGGADPEDDYDNAVRTFHSWFGDRHPEYLVVLNNRAAFRQHVKGLLIEAREDYETIIRIRNEGGHPRDAQAAATFHNLAIICQKMEQFDVAESLYSEAWRIRKNVLKNSLFTARSQAACGSMMFLRGDYLKARGVLEGALCTFDSLKISNDSGLGFCLTNLGNFYAWTGDYATAEKHLVRAGRILANAGWPQGQIDCVAALARLRLSQGRPGDAETLFRSALAIAESEIGPESRAAGMAQIDLALALNVQEKRDAADAAFKTGVRAIESSVGPDAHPLGWAWYERGRELLRRREFQNAQEAFGNSVAILERDLGRSHPQMIRIKLGFAEAWAGNGMAKQAIEEALEANALEMSHLRDNIAYMSEVHALQYRDVLEAPADYLVFLLASHPELAGEYTPKVWQAVLNNRSFILDELIRRRREVAGETEDPAFQAFAAAKNRAANLFVRGVEGHRGASYEKLVKAALQECDDAEKRWAAVLADRAHDDGGDITLSDILAKLPEDAKLLAYVRYGKGLPVYERKPERAYGAFIGDRSGAATFVPLADAAVVDGSVRAMNGHLSHASESLRRDPTGALADYRKLGGIVRSEIWDPVSCAMGDAATIVLIPDGELHLVSIPTLPLGTEKYVADLETIVCPMTAERDLVRPWQRPGDMGLLAMGAAAFDEELNGGQFLPTGASPNLVALRGGPQLLRGLRGIRFVPLPGTEKEVESAAESWRRCIDASRLPVVLKGAEATEAAFKTRAPGHRVLHLATHGFFLADGDSTGSRMGIRWFGIRSGLVFAGANRRDRARPGTEDGVMTAGEVASLNLSGVELVILSACNSGQGETADAEGVFGLRRSFEVAGARTLVMSLWPVGDQPSCDWMRAFYREMCGSRSVAKATNGACRSLLEDVRSKGLPTHPFYWGSFISVGDFE